jgi:chromosome segregation ATPase
MSNTADGVVKSVGEMCEEIKSLKEELDNRVFDKQGAKDCFDLVDQEDLDEANEEIEKLKEGREHDVQQFQTTLEENGSLENEIEELKAEIEKLQEEVPWLKIVHKHLGDPPEVIRLKEENEKLKAELEEKEEEVSLINSEEMENEEDIAKLKAENEKLEYWREHEAESPWEAIIMIKELTDENKKLKEENEREHDGRNADNDENDTREKELKEENKKLTDMYNELPPQ